jgi:uncharacterized surface protein with fasciclin (FAS1) repeats
LARRPEINRSDIMLATARLTIPFLLTSTAAQAAPLAQVLAEDGRFGAFAEGLAETDLLARFEAEGGGTVVAPTDEAFRRMPAALRDRLDRPGAEAALRRILALHLIPSGPHPSDDLPVEMQPLDGDERIVVTYTRGALTLRVAPPDDVAAAEAALGQRAVSEARVRVGDVRTDAAIVHGIDQVLLPYGLEDLLEELGDDGAEAARVAPAEEDREPDEVALASEPAGSEPSAETGEADVFFYGAETADAPEPEPQPATDEPATAVVVLTDDAPAEPAPEPSAPEVAVAVEPPAPEAEAVAEDDAAGDAIPLVSEVVSVADLIGQPVRDGAGAEIGEVVDVLIALDDAEARTLVYAPSPGLVDMSAIGLRTPEETRVDLGDVAIDPLDGAVIVESDG